MQKSLTTVTRNITQQDERLSTLFDKIDRISGEKITSAARAETVFRALTVRELLRRESLREDAEWGELLLGCSVYVNMAMPLESEAGTYARQVMKNIYGGVNYCYVLEFSERNANRIADMVVRLARTGGDARGGVTEDNKTVYDNMHRLRSHFRIYMVHNVGFEYCVFNADVREHAHCYLRLAHWTSEEGTRWLDWASGHAAFVIAEQIDRLRLDGEDKERIIKGSKGCDFYNDDRLRSEGQDFTNRLRAEIKRAVAERQLAEDLISMCIG